MLQKWCNVNYVKLSAEEAEWNLLKRVFKLQLVVEEYVLLHLAISPELLHNYTRS